MEEDMRFRKLFVGSLSLNTSDTGLRNYFLQFGAVTEANVVNDRHGISKGYGFVTFVNLEGAATALRNRFHVIDGRTVKCNFAAFPIRICQPSSSTYRGPRMQFGGAAPHTSSSPFIRPPNNSIHGPGPMQGAGPIPPVYPYGQTSLRNEHGTGNTSVTTQTTSNTSQIGRPMYGPRSMTGLLSVYEDGQSSGSNGPANDNSNTLVAFRSPNYPIYDPGSLQDQHGLPSDFPYEYDQPHSTGNTLVTTQATSNTSQIGRPMYGPRSMTGLPSVYANGQSSDSQFTPNYPIYDLEPIHGLPSDFPYEYDQPPGRNELGSGYFTPVTIQNTRNAAQNDGDRRRGPSRQRRNRK